MGKKLVYFYSNHQRILFSGHDTMKKWQALQTLWRSDVKISDVKISA